MKSSDKILIYDDDCPEHLGQVNMLTLVTNLLLIPLVLTDAFIQPGNWVNYGYLILVSIVIFHESSGE